MHTVVEICAGAGGQSLGLELAGFCHELAVELDANACNTLRHNRPHWKVARGDVASVDVWDPAKYAGVDLLAGGVPCPPFTVAGKQLGGRSVTRSPRPSPGRSARPSPGPSTTLESRGNSSSRRAPSTIRSTRSFAGAEGS